MASRGAELFRLIAIAGVLIVGGAISTATAAEFHSAGAPTTIAGTQTTSHVFTTSAGTVTCKVSTVSGTQATKTASEMTLRPNIEHCTAFGFIETPFDINGCAYRYFANGTTEFECPSGKAIEITAPGCTTKIGSQHLAGGISYTTAGSSPNRTITVTTNLSGITYDECGTVRTNGTFKGTTTITGSAGEMWFA